eukprot:gene9918-2101_t
MNDRWTRSNGHHYLVGSFGFESSGSAAAAAAATGSAAAAAVLLLLRSASLPLKTHKLPFSFSQPQHTNSQTRYYLKQIATTTVWIKSPKKYMHNKLVYLTLILENIDDWPSNLKISDHFHRLEIEKEKRSPELQAQLHLGVCPTFLWFRSVIMFRQILIARASDGLPLVEAIDDDPSLRPYKLQAKKLLRKMAQPSHPHRCTIDTNSSLIFHYYIENGICYMVLCDKDFSKKMAFAFLETIHKEFEATHGAEVPDAKRPYEFIAFDSRIQKIRRSYEDSRTSHRNLSRINHELQDVQRIMRRNIDEVLDRGDRLSELSSQADDLRGRSQKYRKSAEELKWRALMAKLWPVIAVSTIILGMHATHLKNILKELGFGCVPYRILVLLSTARFGSSVNIHSHSGYYFYNTTLYININGFREVDTSSSLFKFGSSPPSKTLQPMLSTLHLNSTTDNYYCDLNNNYNNDDDDDDDDDGDGFN